MYRTDQVTVICIAFNHEKWIEKALVSVLLQDYQPKKLIVVDNGSTDKTPAIIREWVTSNSEQIQVTAIYKHESIPYCKLFNEVLNQVESQFVIDLSGDDFLYSNHLSASIDKLKLVPSAAFVFSDAKILDENGKETSFYNLEDYRELEKLTLENKMYETLICKNYISAPTVVFNAEILKKAGGYDSELSYEDFDIQLRLTRGFPILFSDHIGVLKRKHENSLSARQYQRYHSKMLPSTLRVCEKIKKMNKNTEEDEALKARLFYELKHALWSANFGSARGFAKLAAEMNCKGFEFSLYRLWIWTGLDISWLYIRLT
ncbi:glycosyltransferase [Algoriphagus winogradskyi]|uniref:Glycosyltransferase, GT2 family n=1 Tax=Algoriphagus winogradskyi TaxID=237017 RepID=A0ABY1P079_9BACT|nr:glycosyltransferase [Algoriphagus winogradskyi]SMP21721.1 Glycosyltransferase, GT2 family [Algoriphagus winogradskyi]